MQLGAHRSTSASRRKPIIKLPLPEKIEDSKAKFSIANAIVRSKVARNLQVLDWLAQRYDIERGVQLTKHEAFRLGKARSVMDLRTVEGELH